MTSPRGAVFFWIAQAMLVPAWVCFGATVALRAGAGSPILLQAGLWCGLLQVPCTALALLLALAGALGELVAKKRLLLLYLELAIAATSITLVFLWRGAYRR
jgi:hypothetical protein